MEKDSGVMAVSLSLPITLRHGIGRKAMPHVPGPVWTPCRQRQRLDHDVRCAAAALDPGPYDIPNPGEVIAVFEHDHHLFLPRRFGQLIDGKAELVLPVFRDAGLFGPFRRRADHRFHLHQVAEECPRLRQPAACRQVFQAVEKDIFAALTEGLFGIPGDISGITDVRGILGDGQKGESQASRCGLRVDDVKSAFRIVLFLPRYSRLIIARKNRTDGQIKD